MTIKRVFVRYFWVGILLLLCVFPTAAQGNIIEIQPATGAPGTTVVIRDLGGNRGKTCFMSLNNQATSIGTMAGSITYVIPTNVAPGSVIEFVCTGGTDGLRSNTVTFTATITISGITPSPTFAIVTLSDVDGDGVADAADACPTVVGIPEQNGCPLTISPEPVNPQPPVVIDPPPSLPDLPTSGACVLATIDADPVNIRQGTSTDTAIVGQISPLQVYSVIGRNADSSWFQIDGGWVAGFVTRRGGDCSTLADGLSNTIMVGEVLPADLLVPAVQKLQDTAARLSACPNLLPAVDALPTFLTLDIVSVPDPCTAAQAQLEGLFLGANTRNTAQSDIEDNIYNWANDQCPELFGETYTLIGVLYRVSQRSYDAWQSAVDHINEDTICQVLHELAEYGRLHEYTFLNEYAPTVGIAYCVSEAYEHMTEGWFERVLGLVDFLDVDPWLPRYIIGGLSPNYDMCAFVESIRSVGFFSTGNLTFFNMLSNDCQLGEVIAAQRAIYDAVRGAYDAGAAANLGCAGLNQLESFPLPADLQPTLPTIAQDEACRGSFRLLATHNSSINPELLWRILTSVTPCEYAFAFAYYGTVLTYNLIPTPSCFQDGQVVIPSPSQGTDDVILTTQSSWRQKMLVLDRPINLVCDYINLNPGADGFVLEATPTLPIIVANPTNTPPVFVIEPTATLPVLVAPADNTLPTSPPLLDSSPTPPPPSTEQPPLVAMPTNVSPGQGSGDVGMESITISYEGLKLGAVVPGFTAEGAFDGIYVITSKQHDATLQRLPVDCCPGLMPDFPVSANPGGEGFSYFAAQPNATGGTNAVWTHIEFPNVNAPSATITPQPGTTFLPYAPAWSPDGTSVLFTGTNAAGANQISFYSLDDASGTPYYILENAAAPSIAPNGRMIAFERMDATGRNIYVMATASGEIVAITQQSAGSECFAPAFGGDSLTLFFTCKDATSQNIYRYGLAGVAPLETGIANAQNPSPAPDAGYITFDDGATIYISRDDGANAVPYAQIDGLNLRGLRWSGPPPNQDSAERFFSGIVNRIAAG